MRLRDCPSPGFTWRDLEVFIDYLDNDSALVAKVHPDRAGWTPSNMLLADLIDTARIHVWLSTKDGQEGTNFPEPITRPGVSKPKPRSGSRVKAQPLSEIKKIYGQKPHDTEDKRKLAAMFRTG